MALRELAPYRYRPIHAERGKNAWLEVWPFIFAIVLGPLQRQVLRLGLLVRAPDAARGGINVPRTARHAQPWGRPDRTGRQEPPGATGVETIEEPARGIVLQ